MVSWQLNSSLRWQPFTTFLSVELLSTWRTYFICFTPSLWIYASCLSSRNVSMSHSMSWSWVVRSLRISTLLYFFLSSRCHVGWSSQSKTLRQRWWPINVLMKCNLDHEDCVSLRSPSILPYAWISRRDSCLVGVSCHIPSFWHCSRLAHVCIIFKFWNLNWGILETSKSN